MKSIAVPAPEPKLQTEPRAAGDRPNKKLASHHSPRNLPQSLYLSGKRWMRPVVYDMFVALH
jgi:hypothetical protein